jgi:hypothetical protein
MHDRVNAMNDGAGSGILFRKTALSYGMEGMAMGFMLVMGLFCLFLAGASLYFLGMHMGLWPQRAARGALSAGRSVAAALATGALFVLLLYRVAVRLFDWVLAPGAVEGAVTGKRKVGPTGPGRTISRYITVGDAEFDAGRRAYDSADTGMKVRVTFTRRRRQILRIERIT